MMKTSTANGCPVSVPLSFGTQIGDSLYERGVGGEVIPRDADALDPLCEFLQKALPSQCVAASGRRWSRSRLAVAAPPCSARRWRHGFTAQVWVRSRKRSLPSNVSNNL